jgi:hypothetical protein
MNYINVQNYYVGTELIEITNRKDFRCEQDIPEWGFKFHMNDINASIALGNFNISMK